MRLVHIVTRCGRVQGVFASAKKAREGRAKMMSDYLPQEPEGLKGDDWLQAWTEQYDQWSIESYPILDEWRPE